MLRGKDGGKPRRTFFYAVLKPLGKESIALSED